MSGCAQISSVLLNDRDRNLTANANVRAQF